MVNSENNHLVTISDIAKYNKLKEEPMFVDLVRVGRMLAALNFSIKVFVDAKNEDTSVARRQRWRGSCVIAGYLHESILLVGKLNRKYKNRDYFQNLKKLVCDQEFTRQKEILKQIRNNAAFHLDHEGKSTKKAIKSFDDLPFTLASGDSNKTGEVCFDFADSLDLHYLMEHLNKAKGVTVEEMYETITEFTEQFIYEGTNLFRGLCRELNIKDYVD